MLSIQRKVWEFLDNNPNITNLIKKNIINTRALALYILKKNKIDGTVDSVISAIRRYKLEEIDDYFEKAKKEITKTKSISTRSNVSNIILVKDSEIQGILPKLFSIINYNRGDILRIIQGDGFIEILIDSKNFETVKELFSKDRIIKTNNDLAEISLHLTEELSITPGIIATISNEIAINKINVVEILACYIEYSWFVKQKDLLKTYQIIYKLCRPNKK